MLPKVRIYSAKPNKMFLDFYKPILIKTDLIQVSLIILNRKLRKFSSAPTLVLFLNSAPHLPLQLYT